MELQLEPFGVVELDTDAARTVRGGGVWGALAEYIVERGIENWDEIKQGFVDGLNGTYNPPSQR